MFKEGELHMQQYPVRTIDLEALRENVRLLRSTLPEKTKLMAVSAVWKSCIAHALVSATVPPTRHAAPACAWAVGTHR